MPSHFKKAESPDRALRRVGQDHVAQALNRLQRSRHPASVHGVRKEIKKVRSIFRLVRGEIGRGAFRKAVKGLRRAANRLAATRDARVTLKAFEKLVGPDGVRRYPIIQKALQKNCRRETRRFREDGSAELTIQILRKTNRRLARLKIEADGWLAIEPGLRQSYGSGRQAFKLARKQPSPENLHGWRKHIKYFCRHLQLLCPEWPEASRNHISELEQLSKLLGDDHDLYLLAQFVSEHCTSQTPEAKSLNQLIGKCQDKLHIEILSLGSRLYAEPPAAVCTKLGKHWRAWRQEPGFH